ncbi:MAG TPA: phosphate signaling complex protein PhoU [Thermomicrobiales bacterium]|jgi:phosphate transport system protein
MTRVTYAHQIQQLREDVVAIASMVDKAIARSVDALKLQDVQLARDVIQADAAINQQRWQTEERALMVIATQAPMAGDLRTIAAVIHIVTDLERMADHAAGNARIVIQTSEEPLLKPLVDIPRMSDLARAMLSDSITAFIVEDAEAARAIVARDDEVDDLYNQVYRELLTFMMADPSTINRATHLLWAAHNVERIADRVTNICERVVFAVTGALEEMAVSTY